MKAFKILLISYAIFLLCFSVMFCWLIASYYFACDKTMFEGEQGTTIFGEKVDCSCENQAVGEGFFEASSLILIVGFFLLIIGWFFYTKAKNKRPIGQALK